MSVVIPFSADLTEVRAQLDRLIADARSRPVTIPFSAGGGGGGFGSAGVGGFSSPTIAGAFGGRFGGGGGIPPAGGGGFNFSGSWAQSNNLVWNNSSSATFAPSFSSFAPSFADNSVSNVSNVNNVYNNAARAQAQLRSGGLGRYIGPGFLLHEVLRFGQAAGELVDQRTLAGNDQRALYENERGFQRTVGSFPVLGQAADVVSGYIGREAGFGRAASEAVIGSADAIDDQTAGLKAQGRFSAGLRDRQSVASAANPYEARMRAAEAAFNQEKRQIKDLEDADAERSRKVVDNRKRELDSTRVARIKAAVASGRAPEGDMWHRLDPATDLIDAEDRATLANDTQQATAARNRTYGEFNRTAADTSSREMDAIRREEYFGQRIGRNDLASDLRSLSFSTANDPRAAARENIAGQGRSDILAAFSRGEDYLTLALTAGRSAGRLNAFDAAAAREDRYANADLDARAGITQRLLDRDPLGARIGGIQRERDRELQNPNADENRVRLNSFLQESAARQQYRDEIELRGLGLEARGRQLDIALRGERYGDVSARSAAIYDRANLEAEQLRREDPRGNAPAIAKLYENASKEETLLARDFLQRFKPAELDPNRTDLSSGGLGKQNEVLQVLNQIATNTGKVANNVPTAQ